MTGYVAKRMAPALRVRRTAIFVYMLVGGIGSASWAVRTPALRDILHASTFEIGLILFGTAVGSMAGVLTSPSIVRASGARRAIAIGGVSLIGGIAVIALGTVIPSGIVVFFGFAFLGAGFGMSEIAINVEGTVLEKESGRSVLPTLHGCYSLGTVIGATVGIGLTAIDFPVPLHLFIIAVLGAVAFVWAIPKVSPDTGKAVGHAVKTSNLQAQLAVWKQPRVIMLGIIILALALAEGAATDWLPLIMVDGHDASETVGSIVFTAFALSMTIGRFIGAPVITRFGRAASLRWGSALAAIGIATIVFADNIFVAGAAVLLWGLGTALGFPATLSAAADNDDPTSAVGAVASAGYAAFLIGPPVLGLLGDHFGLRAAMLFVLALVIVAAFLTNAAKPRDAARIPQVSEATPDAL